MSTRSVAGSSPVLLSPAAKLVKLVDKICIVGDEIDYPAAGWNAKRRLGDIDWAEEVVKGFHGCHAALEEQFKALVVRGRAEIS